MHKLVPVVASLALLLWAEAAHAAGPPAVSIQASPTSGAAPLQVTFTASGDPAAYQWDFGDGTLPADSATVEHTYADPGRYTAVVTATAADGQTAQAVVEVTAYSLSLRAPSLVRYGRLAKFSGQLQPAEAKIRVLLTRNGRGIATTRTRPDGTFHVRLRARAPGSFQASFADVASNLRTLRIRPRIATGIRGAALVGSPLVAVARVRPAAAGRIRVAVTRGRRSFVRGSRSGIARVRLQTSSPRVYRIRVGVQPSSGFVGGVRRLRIRVRGPNLSLGARGPAVRYLEQRLRSLHYALQRVDRYFGQDTYDAVVAFQKVQRLMRTGRVGGSFWRRLQTASIPAARYRSGNHLEIDKGRQVLFDVRAGKVARVIQVSTGATGNTPVGFWHVYSKTPGFNALSMYYSMYFLRGFAVHGYPFVPPYPASHGCVRVPLWAAYSLYESHPYGTTVVIY